MPDRVTSQNMKFMCSSTFPYLFTGDIFAPFRRLFPRQESSYWYWN